MNSHALGILELQRLLAHVASRAASIPGANAVNALHPITDKQIVEREHARVHAMRAIIQSDNGWNAEPLPDIGVSLSRLGIEGLSWDATELLQAAALLRASRRSRSALTQPGKIAIAAAFLRDITDALVDLSRIEDAITDAIADDATVRDSASPTLRSVRRQLKAAEGELVRLLEREMRKLEPHHQVSDLSVTMRNGRWVIPVRKEARGYVGGIVHDSSGTGATLFVEPPAAVEFGNRIRELELEEQREVDRVLKELTEMLRPMHAVLLHAFNALVALDCLYARAQYAIESGCSELSFNDANNGLRIVDGRHPLLLARGVKVVPFDLTLTEGERTLLVSGPNTGGKTVLLKAIGLLAATAQCGIPVPVGVTSSLPIFDDIFADVGDEQSIEASLSTFSAHVRNLGEILRHATPNSLVLVDELGSGTDPAEGAALGGAILETLTKRNTLTVATTHLGQLKLLATEVSGVINASLQFDAVQLAPTYRLQKGVPGRSYGLSIARRLQLPDDVMQLAESRLPKGEQDLAVLLAEVESRGEELAQREHVLSVENQKYRSRIASVADREQKLRERERLAEKSARQEARKYLLDARGALETAISQVRAAASEAESATDVELIAKNARRSLEDAALQQQSAILANENAAERARTKQQRAARTTSLALGVSGATKSTAPLKEGDSVKVATLGGRVGRIVTIKGKEARVIVGSLTLTVTTATLERTDAPAKPAIKISLLGDVPEIEPVREIDIRGLRVEEVDDRVVQAIDAAIRADLPELRIIHGKGTGVLRMRVAEMLSKDTRVTAHRLGAWNEGGAGVTVAELS